MNPLFLYIRKIYKSCFLSLSSFYFSKAYLLATSVQLITLKNASI